MTEPKKPDPRKAQPAVTDLPPKDATKDANVKGGRAEPEDDWMEELEVQR